MTSRPRRLARELLAFRAAPQAHRVALRAALLMLLSLLVLWAAGRIDLALYASFGCFTAVYGGAAPVPGRWRIQARHAALLTAAVASGTLVALSPHRSWLCIPMAAGWALLAAALSDRQGWRPPGPMFCVFAVAACGSVPATPARLPLAIGIAAVVGAAAILLGALEERFWPARPAAGPAPGPTPPPHRRRLHALRCAVAVLISGGIATAGGIGHPYWAMVAAVVPLATVTVVRQVARGLQRAAGTLVGLGVSWLLISLSLPTPAVLVLLAGLQGVVELLIARHYGLALVFVTPLALLLGQLATPIATGVLLTDRLVETLIGVAVGSLIAVLTRQRTAA